MINKFNQVKYQKFPINYKNYDINELMLNPSILAKHINLFWNEVFSNLDPNISYISIITKVKFDSKNMGFRALANGRKVIASLHDKDLYIKYICDNLALLTDTYSSSNINQICFSYIKYYKKLENPEIEKRFLRVKKISELANVPTHSIKTNILPISMNPCDFGIIVKERVLNEGHKQYTVINHKKQVFDLEEFSKGIVLRGSIVGGPGALADFSYPYPPPPPART